MIGFAVFQTRRHGFVKRSQKDPFPSLSYNFQQRGLFLGFVLESGRVSRRGIRTFDRSAAEEITG